jgi:protein subunit release factor A
MSKKRKLILNEGKYLDKKPSGLIYTRKGRKEMKVRLEIRAAEGGDDSKLFVKDLAKAYIRLFDRHS